MGSFGTSAAVLVDMDMAVPGHETTQSPVGPKKSSIEESREPDRVTDGKHGGKIRSRPSLGLTLDTRALRTNSQ